jgi:hypothetical protein
VLHAVLTYQNAALLADLRGYCQFGLCGALWVKLLLLLLLLGRIATTQACGAS